MKRATANSDDETETEVQSLCVSNYHLEDDDDMPVSFSVLPIQWGVSESSDANKEQVFLHGSADNGLQKIFMQVTAWKFDISGLKPEISLLSKDRKWVKLQKPRKSFLDTVKTILITLHFLHRVKKNPRISATSVWKNLFKDKELSSYGFKPSKNDLLDHMRLIGEAAKRDAILAKSKLLLMVMEEKLGSQKLPNEEVKDLARPGFIVDDIDNDRTDEADEESEAEDALFNSVCAICDNGGKLLCCDGACMRLFHATEEDGRDSNCDSLGFTQKEVDEIQRFYCKNCEYHLHQCFACGELGSSDKVKGGEVIRCASAACDHFYHPHCVAKLLPQVVKGDVEELERNIANGNPFTCPIHFCFVCKELENKTEPELQFAVCRRCPKSYHRKCLPREIAFDNTDDEDILPRAWEGLLPNNRILIYCLNHEISDELGTPIRDHIKFPNTNATGQAINTTNGRMKSATKEIVILKKNNAGLDNSSGKGTAKKSNVTGKLSSGKVGSNKLERMTSNSNISRKPKSNETSRNHEIDDEVETTLRDHIKFPNTKATVREINTANGRMKKSATNGRVILKKNNAGLDNSFGKSSAKRSKVTRVLSSEKIGSKKSVKMISGSNISREPKSNEISRCLTDNKWSISKKVEMPYCEESQPPISEKLDDLVNKGSTRIEHVSQIDDVVNETLSVKPIRALPPLDADSERSLVVLFKEARSSIVLESVLEKNTFASTHTQSLRNTVEKTIDMGKLEDPDDAVRTALRKPEGRCSIQDVGAVCETDVRNKILKWKASMNGQKRSLHRDKVDQESQEGREFSMSRSGKTSLKRKHLKENGRRGLGMGSPAKRQAVNEMLEEVPNHSQPNPIEGRSFVERFQPKSVMDCPHVEVSDNAYENLEPISDFGRTHSGNKKGPSVACPLSECGVTNIDEHYGREGEKRQRESDMRQRAGLCEIQDPDPTRTNCLSGHDTSCGHVGYSHAQVTSVTKSPYIMNTPTMEQYAPHLDELNHIRMSSLGCELLTLGRSGTSERRVSQPGCGDVLRGFAPGPHVEYSRQNSAGWLSE